MGNAQGFEDVYQTYHERIYRYISRLIGEADAEDVTQEVFLKINAALPGFRGESTLATWIYRIATNTSTDHLRKNLSRPPEPPPESTEDGDILSESDASIDQSIPLPDRQLIRKEMGECIRGIVDSLPENYRVVLVLSEIEEFSNNEIAEVLGISLDTVKIRLHRARARLKKELEHQCSFYRDENNELACDKKPLPFLRK